MAVRLSVVMIHSPPPTANAERISEAIVGELIGLGGIDLSLVEPLDRLNESSTDHLTLTSLTGDIAVLDWHGQAKTTEALARLGISGQRSSHKNDLQAEGPASNQRKLYLFDLSTFDDAKVVVAALSELNAARSVRTFSLGFAPTPTAGTTLPATLGTTSAASGPGIPATTSSHSEPPNRGDAPSTAGRPSEAANRERPAAKQPKNESETDGLDLDELIDQLDQLDP